MVRPSGKGRPSGCELEQESIRTWTDRAFGKQTHLYDNHGQGVHIGLLRRPSLLIPYRPSGVNTLRGAVTDRTTQMEG